MEWFLKCLKQYADFSGRARRTEYWMFTLFFFIIGVVVGIIDGLIGANNVLTYLVYLALFLPSLAVTVRRLHDVGKSGWWYFIAFIPVIGAIYLLIKCCQEGQPGDNKYGPNPKE